MGGYVSNQMKNPVHIVARFVAVHSGNCMFGSVGPASDAHYVHLNVVQMVGQLAHVRVGG